LSPATNVVPGRLATPSLEVVDRPSMPVAVLLYASSAVTVTVAAVPAVIEAGLPETTRVAAAAGLTVMAGVVPVIVAGMVSVAVRVWGPAVLRVTARVWAPLSPARKV
jgi:hypothetical protein